jgi:hypothetical protein
MRIWKEKIFSSSQKSTSAHARGVTPGHVMTLADKSSLLFQTRTTKKNFQERKSFAWFSTKFLVASTTSNICPMIVSLKGSDSEK